MYKNKQVSDSEFLRNLELCFEEVFSDQNEIDDLLIHQGIDPDEDVQNIVDFTNDLLFKRKLTRTRSKREKITEILQKHSESFAKFDPAKIDTLIANIFSGKGDEAIQAAFRDFRHLSDTDKEHLLRDSSLLDDIKTILKDE